MKNLYVVLLCAFTGVGSSHGMLVKLYGIKTAVEKVGTRSYHQSLAQRSSIADDIYTSDRNNQLRGIRGELATRNELKKQELELQRQLLVMEAYKIVKTVNLNPYLHVDQAQLGLNFSNIVQKQSSIVKKRLAERKDE